jgi:hypothetical protein
LPPMEFQPLGYPLNYQSRGEKEKIYSSDQSMASTSNINKSRANEGASLKTNPPANDVFISVPFFNQLSSPPSHWLICPLTIICHLHGRRSRNKCIYIPTSCLKTYVEHFSFIVPPVDVVQIPFFSLDFLRLASVLMSMDVAVTLGALGGVNLDHMIIVRWWTLCLMTLIDVVLIATLN